MTYPAQRCCHALLAISLASAAHAADTNAPAVLPQVDITDRAEPAATGSIVTIAQVVDHAIANYPSIIAARSERQVASYAIDQARALHYPTVDLAGSQRMSGELDNAFGPRVRLNIWASGAIEAQVDRETFREQALAAAEDERRDNVAFDAASAYLALLGALRAREAVQRNYDRHEALVADFRSIARIDPGRRFDLVTARARREQVRFQLAERDAALAQAREALQRYYPFPLEPANLREPAALPPVPPTAGNGLADTLARHPAIAAAERDLLAARANNKVASAQRGPRLDVEARTGANSYSALQLSWPAFDLSAAANEDAAAAALVGAEARVDEERRIVAERLASARQSHIAAVQRESIASGQIDIAEQLVDVYREQFGIGRRNLLDLLNAYAELATAELSAANSRIDMLLTRYQIVHASGQLAEAFARKPQ